MSIIKTATTFLADNTFKAVTVAGMTTTAVAGGAGFVTLDNQVQDNQKEIVMVAEKTDNRNQKSEYEDISLLIAEQNQKIANLEAEVVKIKENQGKSETPTKTETTTTTQPAPKPVTKTEIDILVELSNAKLKNGSAKIDLRNQRVFGEAAKGFSVNLPDKGVNILCYGYPNSKALCWKSNEPITIESIGGKDNSIKIAFEEAKKLLS